MMDYNAEANVLPAVDPISKVREVDLPHSPRMPFIVGGDNRLVFPRESLLIVDLVSFGQSGPPSSPHIPYELPGETDTEEFDSAIGLSEPVVSAGRLSPVTVELRPKWDLD